MIQQLREISNRTLDFLRVRKRDYVHALMTPSGQRVLQDLAKFCRAETTTFDPDPRIHAVLEGRREVWLRIQQHLRLTPEQLYVIYGGATLRSIEDKPNG